MQKKHFSNYELNLNNITVIEQLKFPTTFKLYSKEATALLISKEIYVFKEDIEQHIRNEKKSAFIFDNAIKEYPHFIKTGKFIKSSKKLIQQVYVNLETEYIVRQDDLLYDTFFVRKLRQLDLLDIANFLNYHLEAYYNNKRSQLSKFLKVIVRKFKESLLTEDIIQTVIDWEHETEQTNQNSLSKRTINRDSNDKLTSLSLEQTVLLIAYLQKEKVIFGSSNLSDTTISLAFEVLTGYSNNTIRQSLGKYPSFLNKNNVKAIEDLLERLKTALDSDQNTKK